MTSVELDPGSLSIEERLTLIDRLWLSIAVDAEGGDRRAQEVLDLNRPLDPGILSELARRAEEAERDSSSCIPWEELVAEMRKQRG